MYLCIDNIKKRIKTTIQNISLYKLKVKLPVFIVFITVFSIINTSPQIFANEYSSINRYNLSSNLSNPIAKKSVKSIDKDLELKGTLPFANDIENTELKEEINIAIDKIYTDIVESAKSTHARSIDFSFETISTDDINTILIYTTMTVASGKSDISTVNYSLKDGKIITLKDVLGDNYISITNDFITKKLRTTENALINKFTSINIDQPFYIENNNVMLLFGEYEVTIGADGIVTFPLNLNHLSTYTLNKSNMVNNAYDLPMVPLRTVSEYFGYRVSWDNKTNSVLIKNGNSKTSVFLNKNSYINAKEENISLEAPPFLQDGITYVPTTFFEQILGIIYSIDMDGNITYSKYNY